MCKECLKTYDEKKQKQDVVDKAVSFFLHFESRSGYDDNFSFEEFRFVVVP